jgi:hypothetical protein
MRCAETSRDRAPAIDVDGCSIHSMRPGTEAETGRRVRVEQLEDAERAAPQWESSPPLRPALCARGQLVRCT